MHASIDSSKSQARRVTKRCKVHSLDRLLFVFVFVFFLLYLARVSQLESIPAGF
jgi:hypothetical protein